MKLNVEVEGTWLTPLRYSHVAGIGCAFYVYKCRCGTEKTIQKSNVRARKNGTKSCGCKRRIPKSFDRTGQVPWNKGKPGYKLKVRVKKRWNTGHVKFTYPNGKVVWIKVSDERNGSSSKYYEKPSRAKTK